jgi:hypothetical protein
MKSRTVTKLTLLSAAFAGLLGIAATASAGSPPMQVTIFDAAEKVAFKGPLGHGLTFATHNLPPGKYVVQFNSRTTAATGQHYFLAISAGRKKVIADAVAGELLAGRGAAMRVDVGRGLRITGQVVREDAAVVRTDSRYRLIDGRPYIWLATELGSNLGGRWVDASIAPSSNINSISRDFVVKAQDHAGEGSMIAYGYGSAPIATGHGY